MTARALKAAAKVCLGLGSLLLAFVTYQLWGTSFYEHHAQALLSAQLQRDLGVPVAKFPTGTAPSSQPRPKSTTTTTTTPTSLMSNLAPAIAAPAVGAPIGLMSVPRLGMTDEVIVEGTGERQLQQGPGHYQGTPLPGEAGNAAIAGHRTTYGHPFYDLDAMEAGDYIYIQTTQGLFSYQVTSTNVVAPTDTQVLAASSAPMLTLTTCNPRYSSSTRLVVTALLRTAVTSSSFPAGETTKPPAPADPSRSALPALLAGEGGDVNTNAEAWQGALWGALALAVAVLALVGWRRSGPGWKWPALGTGLAIALVLLFICFAHVSLALPETF